MKVETDIITSMAVSLIPVIMDVKTFKTNVIVSICNIIMCLMSQTDDFQLDTDIIRDSSSILTLSLSEINGNVYKLLINEITVAR